MRGAAALRLSMDRRAPTPVADLSGAPRAGDSMWRAAASSRLGADAGTSAEVLRAPGATTLRTAIAARISPAAAQHLGLGLLAELAALHARGAVHGALAPERVWIAPIAGGVGASALRVGLAGGGHAAAAGAGPGAAAYLAPEQLAGGRSIDARADLWAAAAILYEALAGVPPYRGARLGELLSAIAVSEPVPIAVHLPSAPPALAAFFARALSRDRARRYPTAPAMADALAAPGWAEVGIAAAAVGFSPRARPARTARGRRTMSFVTWAALSATALPPAAPGSRRDRVASAAPTVAASAVQAATPVGAGGRVRQPVSPPARTAPPIEPAPAPR